MTDNLPQSAMHVINSNDVNCLAFYCSWIIRNIRTSSNNSPFNPEKIILGCTHYPYLMNEFVKFAPKELFIDPAQIFVDFIKQDLGGKCILNNSQILGREEFYVSSNPEEFVTNAKIFYEIKELPSVV